MLKIWHKGSNVPSISSPFMSDLSWFSQFLMAFSHWKFLFRNSILKVSLSRFCLTKISSLCNKKHLKNVGPICHCEPPHAHSPGVAVARRLRIDVHDDNTTDNDNDNVWQRGPLWLHGMGQIKSWIAIEYISDDAHVCKLVTMKKFRRCRQSVSRTCIPSWKKSHRFMLFNYNVYNILFYLLLTLLLWVDHWLWTVGCLFVTVIVCLIGAVRRDIWSIVMFEVAGCEIYLKTHCSKYWQQVHGHCQLEFCSRSG